MTTFDDLFNNSDDIATEIPVPKIKKEKVVIDNVEKNITEIIIINNNNNVNNTIVNNTDKIIKIKSKSKSQKCQCSLGSPIYNIVGQKALYCSKCKTPEMINVCTKRCFCGISYPIFNIAGEIAKYCKTCKLTGMVNVKSRLCKCKLAIPVYNFIGTKTAICCKKCKQEGMINIKDKKCNCNLSIPVYNYETEITPRYCKVCKLTGMIDIVNKNKLCSCDKKIRATFNVVGEKAKFCSSCKTIGMVNVIDRKCKCGKVQPTFNLVGEKQAVCCNSCKTPEMIDIKNVDKLCTKCKKYRANFNVEGETKGKYCKECANDGMNDVIHTKCKGQDGTCPLKQRGSPKYKNYCSACFAHNFPLDPLTLQKRSKTKEIAVRDFINSKYEGFQHDKVLWTGNCDCSIRRRIDHRKLIGNTLLVIETDENQHKSYNKMDEEIRYDDLFMAYSGKWIYLRLNVDSFVNSNGISKNPLITDRFNTLEKEINKQIKRIEKEKNKELLEIIYLYYNGYEYNK